MTTSPPPRPDTTHATTHAPTSAGGSSASGADARPPEGSARRATPAGAARARNDLNRNPYSWGELAARVAWGGVSATAFRWSPAPLRGWRRLLLRAFGARVGRGASVHRTARVEMPWRVTLGEFATVGREAWLYSVGSIDVGAHATVGPRCVLCAGDHDLDDPATPLRRPAIRVGAHAWLGMGVFVGPGVTIGDGCVVGAASAVFGDLPSDTTCHGHPARVVRGRGEAGAAAPADARDEA